MKPKIIILILLSIVFSLLTYTGVIAVNSWDSPILLCLAFIIIPLSFLAVSHAYGIHSSQILFISMVFMISITSVIPLRGLMVAGDFGHEFIAGRHTLETGHIILDNIFKAPHYLVAVNSILNPLLSIITGLHYVRIFSHSAQIPSILILLTIYLISKRVIRNNIGSYLVLMLITTQFFIIEACLWSSRYIYSLALFLILIYMLIFIIPVERTTFPSMLVLTIITIGIGTYYYSMGIFSSFILLLYTIWMKIFIRRYRSPTDLRILMLLAFISFTSTYLWYHVEDVLILTTTDHIRKAIEFVINIFKDENETIREVGIIGKELLEGISVADMLTLGSIIFIYAVAIYGLVRSIKDRSIPSQAKSLSHFILLIITISLIFTPLFIQGNVGLYRLYYIASPFLLLMIPHGIKLAAPSKRRKVCIFIAMLLIILSILSNARLFYSVLNEEPLPVTFTRDCTNDYIWRISEPEASSSFFLITYGYEDIKIYGDQYSLRRLMTHFTSDKDLIRLQLFTSMHIINNEKNVYIYLSRYNLIKNTILPLGKVHSVLKDLVVNLRFDIIKYNSLIYNNPHSIIILS